ncbi:MAG: hypothetical protein COC01_09415 [Bacteroidetes bacterium]|nr:MAG: hypothetical protein COC01_09415 [Bacteroidota bacterium]
MKKNILLSLSSFVLIICLFASSGSFAQCDTTANRCENHLSTDYISDGQQYRALLLDDETAEFHATFFGGSTYRIAGCSGLSDGNLIFSLYDPDRNLLYTNNDYRNAPFWDFTFTSTTDCTIEAQLESLNQSSGCAVLLIGFKR